MSKQGTDTVMHRMSQLGCGVGSGLPQSALMEEAVEEMGNFGDEAKVVGTDNTLLCPMGLSGITNLFGEKVGLTTNFEADKEMTAPVSDYTSEDISFYMGQVDHSNVVAIFSPPTRKCLPMRIINFFLPHTESVDNSRSKVIYAPDSVPERSVQIFKKGRNAAPRQIILRERFATVL